LWATTGTRKRPDDVGLDGPFAEFWERLVSRYGSRVTVYEPWNEPNNMFWSGNEEYAALARMPYQSAVAKVRENAHDYCNLIETVVRVAKRVAPVSVAFGSIEWNPGNPLHRVFVDALAESFRVEWAPVISH